MFEALRELDKNLFVYLNGMGSTTWDPFWLFITNQANWIPLFAIILYLAFKRLGWRHAIMVTGLLALLILCTNETTDLIKNTVQRLRPVNNPSLAGIMRHVINGKSFSFISGHSSNSMAVAVFVYRVLHPYLKYIGFFFLWPLLFAYSRIYLGMHYPTDIISGYLFGLIMGWLFSLLYIYLRDRYFPEHKDLDNPANSEPITNG